MRKKLAAALAVMVVASVCLTACSKMDTDAATGETATAETATGETAAIEYDLGLDDDGYFRNVTASKYIKMPKGYKTFTVSEDVYTVTDDAIQKELDAFQSNYNLTEEVTGRAAQSGDVVNIAPGVKHWHGAKADSWFSHIAVEVPGEDCSNEWCEPVSDAEYQQLQD